jgi:hypothetical protein
MRLPAGPIGVRMRAGQNLLISEGVTPMNRSISVLVVIPRADISHRERDFAISQRRIRGWSEVHRNGSEVDFKPIRQNFLPFEVDRTTCDALQIILLSHKRPSAPNSR